jgi:hypothetical protein
VGNLFTTTNNVITTTNYVVILVEVQQSGVKIELNGVNQPLLNSSFTSTLTDLNIDVNPYTGARNNQGVVDTPSNSFIGDHLFYPKVLTAEEKQNILNYFV